MGWENGERSGDGYAGAGTGARAAPEVGAHAKVQVLHRESQAVISRATTGKIAGITVPDLAIGAFMDVVSDKLSDRS